MVSSARAGIPNMQSRRARFVYAGSITAFATSALRRAEGAHV